MGGGGQQPPRSSQRPGGKHISSESAQRAEKRQTNKTHNAQSQGRGDLRPGTRESQRQRGRTKRKHKTGGGEEKKSQGPRHPGPETKESWRQRRRAKGTTQKERQKKRQTKEQERGNSSLEGAEQSRKTKRPKEKVRRTRTRPQGRPARPSQEGRAHKHTRTGPGRGVHRPARGGIGVQKKQPHAPAKSPVERRTVRETGRVSDRVHTRQPPQHTQPKTDAGGTRQVQPHRGAPNGYDAERAQRPCLGGSQRQAQ